MLESSWEPYCTEAVNANSAKELIAVLDQLVKTCKVDLSVPALVVYGHDTRPTCPMLVKAVVEGLATMGATVIDAGLKTTPQLHYLVRAHNTQGTPDAYGEPTEMGYYDKLSKAFAKLVVSGGRKRHFCLNGLRRRYCALCILVLIPWLSRLASRQRRPSSSTVPMVWVPMR